MNIDQQINDIFVKLADISEAVIFYSFSVTVPGSPESVALNVPVILLWLMAAGLFFTCYYSFINLRLFRHSFDIIRGKYEEPDAKGQLSNFQSLMASLAGTVGLGNIAGVAVAVSVGGPGATIWMIVMGFIGMSTKFTEVTAGVKYRRCFTNQAGQQDVSGGPMYYLQDSFAARGLPAIGRFLAVVFALCCIGGAIGGGNMFQANQTYMQFLNATGGAEASFLAGKGWLFGLVLAFLTGIVIIGGIKSIANVSSYLVPVMALVYLAAGCIVIGMNIGNVPEAIATIFREAFTPAAGIGGVLGAMLVGVKRASFSNEAGLGSAAIVQSCARTDIPVRQGIASMMGPFLDTVVICTMTALVIVVSGVYEGGKGMEGIELTSRAFETAIPGASYFLAFTVFLFAYSTLIGWAYYGVKGVTYIFGEKAWLETGFKLVFCGFVVVGCASDLGNVIRFTDAMILSMAFPNIIGLYVLAPEIKKDLKVYLENMKAAKAARKIS